jgi:preprotein translocase subunit YajC
MISEAKKKYGKKMSETAINEDHFKVGDTVTCTASGMKGKVVKLDKPETGKYYHVKREDGKTVKYAPSDLKKSTKVKEEIYTAKMGQPPQDIDGGSAPAPKKPATASKTPAASKKPATASKTPATKVKEGADKKEDPPFDPDPPKTGPRKDKFGNEIKNVAKHLAKKGREEAEKSSSKKKEKVSESWTHDNLAAKLFETSEDHHDHEASMAKAQLMRIAEQSIELFKMIQEGDNLEGWVASKITKANDYINAVHQNLSYEAPKEKTIDSTDDYIAELRKNLERQISN